MSKKQSLAEKFASLANPAPVFHDPEEDEDLDTRAQLVDVESEESETENEETSKLRLQTSSLLEDTDQRYAGKKLTRKQLEAELGFSDVSADEELQDLAMQILESDNEEIDDKSKDDDDNESDMLSDDDDDDDGGKLPSKSTSETTSFSFDNDSKFVEMSGEESDSSDNDSGVSEDKEDKETVNKLSRLDLHDDIEKGVAVRNQLGLWDRLLECRILIQKVLSASNQLPQYDVYPRFVEQGQSEFQKSCKKSEASLQKLLDQLINLQTLLLMRNPETKNIAVGNQKSVKQEESDEEIPSDTDEELENDDAPIAESPLLKRKLKMHDYPGFLSKRHRDLVPYRNVTIEKWSEKLRVSSGKVKSKSYVVQDQSTMKQIEQILLDQPRLIRRTQLQRSGYKILGKKTEMNTDVMKSGEEISEVENIVGDLDPEIFDDDDFYHQLLHQLIEQRSTDLNDPVKLGRQWLELQKLRSKVKRNIDTRATKGRKIRYEVHKKMVNFMAPIDKEIMSEEAKDELFSSLFGRRITANIKS